MRALKLVILFITFSQVIFSQCSFNADNNGFEYTVDVDLTVQNIIYTQSGSTCNINFEIDYDIDISIINAPAWWNENLYTLQGNIECLDGSGPSFFDLPNDGGTGSVTSATFSFSNTDCAEAEFDCPITITINGPEIPNQSSDCGTFSLGVVPVVLNKFSAESDRLLTKFSWETTSEINFSHFDFQTSNDARSWSSEHRVQSNNSDEGSDYALALPNRGEAYFARLVMVDYDGSIAYSDVLSVSKTISSSEVLVYPNPTNDKIFFTNVLGPLNIQIYDFNGTLVLEESQFDKALNIADLPKGQYILKIIGKNIQPQIEKIIKI